MKENSKSEINSIEKGIAYVRGLRGGVITPLEKKGAALSRLSKAILEADAILVGAGAGLSTAAGLTYSGERFQRYFGDFATKYGMEDIYSGGFYPFEDEETFWAWWARAIYVNRYVDPPKPVYKELLSLLNGKEYFVLTTNVDHQFQRAGFPDEKIFATQGDYGLLQSLDPNDGETYPNEEWVKKAMEAEGFVLDAHGVFVPPADRPLLMKLPTSLIPLSPTGAKLTTNLRADDSFVEDSHWHKAQKAYHDFLNKHSSDKVLYLEIGVGENTPVIIKYPFYAFTAENPNALYACISFDDAYCPFALKDRSILMNLDAGEAIHRLLDLTK